MTESLDKILSSEGDTAPKLDATKTETVAPKEVQQTEKTEPQDDVVDHTDGRKLVPLEALTEARGKVKRYTEQVAEFDKSVSGLRDQNSTLQRQVTELLQRLPQPKQEPAAPTPDYFENPALATRHEVQQTVGPQFEQLNQTVMANAQIIASVKYGDDKVANAEKAFIEALQGKTIDPADYQKVVNSPNRYAAAVQWHERVLATKEIGPDPAAYRAKLEAEILAKHGLTPETVTAGGDKPAQAAPVMPSNLATARNVGARSGPAWSGPTPLGDIFKR